jgi:aspartyl protease family protein
VAENQNFLHATILTLAIKLRNRSILFFCATLFVSAPVCAVDKIALHALFKDKAILVVDGTRRVLKTGEATPEGVKLLSTNTQEELAEVEVDGKRRELRLGMVAAAFTSTGKGSITLYPDRSGHFFADGLLNGTSVRMMVDTGATLIAMNSATAQRIGVDYRRNGKLGASNTAGGYVRSYYLKLDSVQVGDIKFFNVDAAVLEGAHPTEVLLGMSFLGHLDMRRDGEKMELKER